MRCMACDKILTEAEDRRTFTGSGRRVQLCKADAFWVDMPMSPLTEEPEDDDEAEAVETQV